MPAGLQVFNDSDTIQVDSTWKNFSLVSRTVINSSKSAWQEPDLAGAVYANSGINDLVFVYCATPFLAVGVSQQSGVRYYRVGTGNSENIPVTFYTFRGQQPTSSSYGLQVFNETGEITFDSLNKMNRIVGLMPIAPGQTATFYNFNRTRKYAVMIPNFIGQLIQQDTGGGTGNMGFRYFSTNSPRLQIQANGVSFQDFAISSVKQVPIQNPTGAVIVTNITGAPYVVCDVTGYD